jgi:hypothetical protein
MTLVTRTVSPAFVSLPCAVPSTQSSLRTAVRRGAASCRAVLRSWPVTAAAGVVTAEPSSVAECRGRCDPSEVAPPAGGRRRGGRSGCPDTGHAVRRSVRILCPPCGQTSVQRVGRTSDVHASSVHATGVMRMSGQTGVRCPRPLQPCCPHRAGFRNAPVPRDWPRWAHRVRRVAVVGERLGRRCPNRACREGWSCVGQCVAGTSGDGRPGPPLRTGKGGGAALTAWATKGAGAALGAGRVAGGHGKEQVRTRRSAGASRTGCRRGARHGLDREVVTTVSGRCAGVGPVSSGSGGPIRFGGEQPAAAARPRYVRSAVRSALTAR